MRACCRPVPCPPPPIHPPPCPPAQIEVLHGRIHNTPALPSLVRAFNGLWLGYVPHLLEPVWSLGAEVRCAAGWLWLAGWRAAWIAGCVLAGSVLADRLARSGRRAGWLDLAGGLAGWRAGGLAGWRAGGQRA
jgi:hypothetical protein